MQNVPYSTRNVERIISGCQTLAADQYLNRHNQAAAQLHLDICRHYGIKVEAECWYQHKPERVMENEKATILWDSPIITDKHVPCNKPDIVIQEKKSDCRLTSQTPPQGHLDHCKEVLMDCAITLKHSGKSMK